MPEEQAASETQEFDEHDPIRETAINALACTLVNRYTFQQAVADEDEPDAQTVWLRVGNQFFRLDGTRETEASAQWMRNMLSTALARLVLEQSASKDQRITHLESERDAALQRVKDGPRYIPICGRCGADFTRVDKDGFTDPFPSEEHRP